MSPPTPAKTTAEAKRALLARLLAQEARQAPESAPLSGAQRRLWFVNQLHPGQGTYNIPTALRMHGSLDHAVLQQSLATIVQRHEILRTVYEVENGHPRQTLLKSAALDVPVVHLQGADLEQELSRRLTVEASRPFDLSRDLMLRAIIFQLGPQDHVLFLNLHHIAADEWSLGVLFRELALLYQAGTSRCDVPGRVQRPESDAPQPALPPLALQYSDFTRWQNESAASDTIKKQIDYWRDRLSGISSHLELPADRTARPGSNTHTQAGGRVSHRLPSDLAQRLRSFARDEGVTLFQLLLAGFTTLMHRCTGQSDLTVGTPVSGRNRLETEDLVGFFVNILPIRASLNGNPSFREVLARVRAATVGAFANQDVPFDRLVEELKPDRQAAANPFFNVVFAVNTVEFSDAIPGLQLELIEVSNNTAKFDLNFTFQGSGAALTAVIEYDASLFSPAAAERLAIHCETLLQGAVENPDRPVSLLPLLTDPQRRRILVEWNDTATPFPATQCLHELFEKQAAATPDAPALVFGETRLSYAELNARANQVAHFLRGKSIKPDTAVGICVERSADMIVGILGILKAGGAYLPLDTSYPPERLAFMARDASAPIVLSQKRLASNIKFEGSEVICFDRDWPRIAAASKANPANQNQSENLAYITYTSGSTGTPKGICIPHRAVARLVFNTNYIQFSSAERIAQISNASFDAATFEIWGALLFGGQLIGMSRETVLSPRDLAAELARQKITSLFLTTALFNQIAADTPKAFVGVTNLLVGGDALDPASVRRVLENGAPRRLVNGYGPTECTTFALCHHITSVDESAPSIPIGRPISNTSAYILDAHLQPVPIGVPGELCLGGPGLARGYLNRPELTAAKFIPHPFSAQPGELLYRTGDLARFREDGVVEFLGRMDNQVKLRGFRIELGEIESALAQHKGVAESVVIAREFGRGDKRLVGYVVPRAGDATPDNLRDFLKARLPDYMVPSSFVLLDKMPLTPNGKVDRRALPAPESSRQSADPMSGLPRNSSEKELVRIWESVLKIQPIGIRDNFFDLGGHSLLAVRLFTEIEKSFGRKIPLAALFQAPTIEHLGTILDQDSISPAGSCIVDIQTKGSRLPIFWLHTLGGGGGGGLFTYQKLAELLGPDQPSYGLLSPASPHTSLEEMATHYIGEMRTRQPEGPYQLGGYCFGGVVAYEMARQLAERGEEVRMLALIDSAPPNTPRDFRVRNVESFLHATTHSLRWMRGNLRRRPAGWRAALKRARQNLWQRFKARSAAPREARLDDVIDLSQYPPDYRRYAEGHWKALTRYAPKPYAGVVTLFRAKDRSLTDLSPTLGWGTLARSRVKSISIAGRHETILQPPYVASVAGALRSELDRCNRMVPPTPSDQSESIDRTYEPLEVLQNTIS